MSQNSCVRSESKTASHFRSTRSPILWLRRRSNALQFFSQEACLAQAFLLRPELGQGSEVVLSDRLLRENEHHYVHRTLSTCPVWHVPSAPQLLACSQSHMDTCRTYHRTWETGVGYGHEGHRIQPLKIFQHLSPKLLLPLQSCGGTYEDSPTYRVLRLLVVLLCSQLRGNRGRTRRIRRHRSQRNHGCA